MKAILIDPFNKTVTEVEHNGNYKHIYELLSHETHPVDCFTAVGIDNGDTIFVDDEGLFKEPTEFFVYLGYDQPLAGKGLVLGCNDDGDSVAPVSTLEQVKKHIVWMEDIQLDRIESYEGKTDHPLLGKNTPVIGSYPVFKKREPDESKDLS
jgi:hypothetical protein